MKIIATVALAAFIALGMSAPAIAKAGRATAGDMEIDGSLVVATAPVSGFDTGLGITIGGGAMLPQIDRNLQGRIDLSYFKWSASQFGVDVSYTRIPLLFSGRYFVPTRENRLKVYVQGGLELSYDKVEASVLVPSFIPPFGVGRAKVSSTETRLGLVPGVGIEYMVSPTLGLVADARWHIITDSYLTAQFGLASHF